MTGLQDPNRMANLRLGADQVACRVNNISKATLRDDWQFGKPPYSHANPVPMVPGLCTSLPPIFLFVPTR